VKSPQIYSRNQILDPFQASGSLAVVVAKPTKALDVPCTCRRFWLSPRFVPVYTPHLQLRKAV